MRFNRILYSAFVTEKKEEEEDKVKDEDQKNDPKFKENTSNNVSF